jgi:phage FluMu protein Com
MGKCPKCENFIANPNANPMQLNIIPTGNILNGMVVTCPHCNVILSITTDPYALVNTILKSLKE